LRHWWRRRRWWWCACRGGRGCGRAVGGHASGGGFDLFQRLTSIDTFLIPGDAIGVVFFYVGSKGLEEFVEGLNPFDVGSVGSG